MSLTLFTSSIFADHLTPPGHPERVERFEIMQAVAAEFRQKGIVFEEMLANAEQRSAIPPLVKSCRQLADQLDA